MSRFVMPGYNPTPIQSPQNALMQGIEMHRAQQGNALQNLQLQALMQRQQQAQQEQQRAAAMEQQRQQYLGAVDPSQGPAMPFNPLSAFRAGFRPEEIKALQPQPQKLMNVGAGGAVFDPATGKPVFTAPFKPEPQKIPQIGELQSFRDGLPQGDPRRREVQAVIDNQTRAPKYAAGPGAGPAAAPPKPPKPLPAGAMKMQQESLDKIGIASSINADLAGIDRQIESGKLSFGPVSNLMNTGRNMAGISSEESRNFGTFKSTLERLRNESLRLNTGVQTDGDAQRAWNELFQNINDTGLVRQRLAEIQAINKRGADLQRLRVDSIRNEYGVDPLDASAYGAQPSAIGAPAAAAKPAASGLSPQEQAELDQLRTRFGKGR